MSLAATQGPSEDHSRAATLGFYAYAMPRDREEASDAMAALAVPEGFWGNPLAIGGHRSALGAARQPKKDTGSCRFAGRKKWRARQDSNLRPSVP